MEKIYIGTYSNHIEIGEFDNGNLKIVNKIEGIENPSYLHINKDILYAVSETKIGGIAAFKNIKNSFQQIDLKIINQSLPCHITTNKKRNHLLVANYGSGSVIMYQLKNDGSFGKKIEKKEYQHSHMHFAKFIENNIYAVDLGNDTIRIYNNEMNVIGEINTNKKSGPRHLAVDKDNKRIYIVTEMSNQVIVYQKNENEFKLIQEIDTLPNQLAESFAGAIKISNDNKYIYVTNRGHDSISVFKINKCKLKLIQNISSYGSFPRDILLNSTEEYAIVANQRSNNIVIFKRNMKNGTLTKSENAEVIVEKPSCIVRSNYEI